MGEPFPEFDLEAYLPERGEVVRFTKGDLLGRWTIVYFYPRDGTPGCTKEAQDFTSRWEEIRAWGVMVVGVSRQSPESHRKFAQKYGLKHPLLTDDGSLGQSLGIMKQTGSVERSTFLLAPDGTIQKTWRRVKVPGHGDEVMRALREFLTPPH